jgi:hypothetical protein
MFVYAAGLKFAYYDRAGGLLHAYSILPRQLALPAGFALPWIELLAGVLLLIGTLQPAGPLLATTLGAVFAYGSYRVLHRGASVPCGCAASGDRVSLATLVRALVIAAAGVLVFLAGEVEPVAIPVAVAAILIPLSLLPGAFAVHHRIRVARLRDREARARTAEIKRLQRLITAHSKTQGTGSAHLHEVPAARSTLISGERA